MERELQAQTKPLPGGRSPAPSSAAPSSAAPSKAARSKASLRGAGLAAAACAASLALAPQAQAAGIAAARFGGEHGHPTTTNATAIYYNPAGIALSRGTHIFLDASLALRSLSYDRPENQISNPGAVAGDPMGIAANSGSGSLFNQIAAPFAGVTSDFGTDWIAAGVGWYYPFGGSAVWDQNSKFGANDPLYPGAVDGVQRWYSIDGTIRSMYITGALAFNIRPWNLSIGVSGSVIRSEVHTLRARNGDGSDDLISGSLQAPLLKEGRSEIKASGLQGGFAVGVIWQPVPDELWLGVSYTSQPNISGGMRLKGTLRNILTTGNAETTDIDLTQTMPDILRFGARYRPFEDWEFRFFGDYTRWSAFDRQCVINRDLEGSNCRFAGLSTALQNPGTFGAVDGTNGAGVIQHLPRLWRDSFGLRVGASWWVLPELETYLGAGYDSNAIPDETLDPALTDADKVSLSLGARWQMVDNLAMALTFTQLIYFERDNSRNAVNNDFLNPTRQPGNGGVYNQSISLFNLYADISF